MKNLFIIAIAISAISFSCNQGAKNPGVEVPITRKEINSEVIKTVAQLHIAGMTCSAGCGGKIQADLRAMQGVTTTELDFEDARAINVVAVEFNPTQISESALINCVNAISDGQYKVESVEILTYKGLQSAGRTGGSDVSAENLGRVFQILNLLQSVSKLVQ